MVSGTSATLRDFMKRVTKPLNFWGIILSRVLDIVLSIGSGQTPPCTDLVTLIDVPFPSGVTCEEMISIPVSAGVSSATTAVIVSSSVTILP